MLSDSGKNTACYLSYIKFLGYNFKVSQHRYVRNCWLWDTSLCHTLFV